MASDTPSPSEQLRSLLADVRSIVSNFRIVGSGVSGSFQRGYKITPGAGGGEAPAIGGGGPPVPPAISTGACCDLSQNCSILSQADCFSIGGHFQGEGTTCSPDPCAFCGCPLFLSQVTVIISGVTSCGCLPHVGNGEAVTDIPTGINGTYILTQISGSHWEYLDLAAVLATSSHWFNEDCSGDPASTDDMTGIHLTLDCLDGSWNFSFGISCPSAVTCITIASGYVADCLNDSSIVPNQISCNWGANINGLTGGTVQIFFS